MFLIQRLLLALVVGVGLSVISMIALGNVPAATWDTMQSATCFAAEGCFCEAVQLESAVRQPSNTVSSFGFVLAGVVIAAVSPALKVKTKRFPAIYGAAFGVMAVIVGVGSAYYHASLTFIGQFFDILGMYLLAAFVLVYALQRLVGWRNGRSMLVYISLNLILTVFQIIVPEARRYTFAVVLLIGLVVEYVYRLRHKPAIRSGWLQLGLAVFALAYGIWILDNSRLMCLPESVLQGHAAWHVLGACAVLCLFQYYTSESATKSAPDGKVS
ncbi:MAG: ceramidase domain-containing protein [Anaerolineae bacterium]